MIFVTTHLLDGSLVAASDVVSANDRVVDLAAVHDSQPGTGNIRVALFTRRG